MSACLMNILRSLATLPLWRINTWCHSIIISIILAMDTIGQRTALFPTFLTMRAEVEKEHVLEFNRHVM